LHLPLTTRFAKYIHIYFKYSILSDTNCLTQSSLTNITNLLSSHFENVRLWPGVGNIDKLVDMLATRSCRSWPLCHMKGETNKEKDVGPAIWFCKSHSSGGPPEQQQGRR